MGCSKAYRSSSISVVIWSAVIIWVRLLPTVSVLLYWHVEAICLKNWHASSSYMVGLRNLLVYEYTTIDVEKLYRYLDQLPDFIQFIESVQPYL